ncbi:MAG: hypothetical protein Q9200_000456 [Gallowayella weberi]
MDEEYPPGTVRLVDVQGISHAKHASGVQQDIVLVPAPSDDPDDPLNWSPRRKILATASTCVFLAPVLAGFINDGQGWQWVLVEIPPCRKSG